MKGQLGGSPRACESHRDRSLRGNPITTPRRSLHRRVPHDREAKSPVAGSAEPRASVCPAGPPRALLRGLLNFGVRRGGERASGKAGPRAPTAGLALPPAPPSLLALRPRSPPRALRCGQGAPGPAQERSSACHPGVCPPAGHTAAHSDPSTGPNFSSKTGPPARLRLGARRASEPGQRRVQCT